MLKKIVDKFEERQPDAVVWQIKVICAVVLVYKLLSRDFSNLGLWPESVLLGYPVDIYPPNYILLTAIPPIFDLISFHFIHWFVPIPNISQFYVLQHTLIIAAVALAISPLRYTRMIAVVVYVLCMYLWGFIYRAGQDIDAMFLLQGCFLVLAMIPRAGNERNYSGYVYSSVLLVFVFYYFFSGVNKVIDLSVLEWFQYSLFDINASKLLAAQELNYHAVSVVEAPGWLLNLASFIGAAITYVVHLAAPLIFMHRSRGKLIFYWCFYSVFHVMSSLVGILFAANLLVWLAIIPIFSMKKDPELGRKNDENICIVYDGECPFCSNFVMVANLKKRYENLKIINARNNNETTQKVKREGYNLNDGMLVIRGDEMLFGAEAARFIVLNGSGGFLYLFYKAILSHQKVADVVYPMLVVLRKRYLKLAGKDLI